MINFSKLVRTLTAEAHCDIPCGIYDPVSAKIAAQTVQKMVMRINALEKPSCDDGASSAGDWATYENTLARYVTVKEEHAQLCKKELYILWADYFRPEHVEQYPDLHSLVWNAGKLAGRNKQTVDAGAAEELVGTVDKIAEIFWNTKNVTYSDPNAEVRFGA
ncbi:MAG: superoxide dismutase, Ni [SAR202 cluster bacterium]|nr:superoxide dismutase, Ni [SAR202 cluster bacterium]|tara:strand:+ start:18629 stop:19114 length:486 start_codon:yes stop_codon:yes gene_type:complete